jgi:hypothetical protein
VLRLRARCNQAVSGKVTGQVSFVTARGKHMTIKLHAVRERLRSGRSTAITVRLPSSLVRALKDGHSASASFALTAADANGTAHASAKVAHVKLRL